MFTYHCSSLSSSGSTNNGTIGFNSDGNFFENYGLSGSSRLLEVACVNHPRTAWNNIVYSLTPISGKDIYFLVCGCGEYKPSIDLTVSLTSTPSGPTYQAATWVTFLCSASGGSGLYGYKWRVHCASTGVVIYESLAGPANSFRIKSTPSLCYDRVECVAEDTVLPLTGSTFATITSVTGTLHCEQVNH